MPNNRKIKKNRGGKDYSIFAQIRRAGTGKITRARILKRSRRKRATRAAIDSLAKAICWWG